MLVKFSQNLTSIKPVCKMLLNELLKTFSFATILATDTTGKSYRVSKSGTTIASNSFPIERGFVVRVYDDTSYAEYAFSYLDESIIPQILKEINASLVPLSSRLPEGLQVNAYGIINDQPLQFSKASELTIDPETYGDDKIVERLTKIYEKGIRSYEEIVNFSVAYDYCHVNKLFLSKNKDIEQSFVYSTGFESAFSMRGENGKMHFNTASGQCGIELMEQLESMTDEITSGAIALLDSTPIEPGEYECICSPDITGLIAHEAFGHGVEMDMFVKDRALAHHYIGKQVASELVTMHDSSSVGDETGSYFFDDEGMPAQDTIIIDHGILVRGINDAQTSLALNVASTGNGRRQTFSHKAYTRMTNTYFEPGNSTFDEMIASISYGILIEEEMSGMEDPKNWGIQCIANIGREIKDGKLTGKIFSPLIMTGYVPDLLKSISMVSKDCKLSGSGGCGKGYKEWVKVSCGGPYIKAKIRLG